MRCGLRELQLQLTMGHRGSRVIASVMLERVNYEDRTALRVDLPRETVRMDARRDSGVREDSETNRAFFIILHSLEEQALEPSSLRRCDLNDTTCLVAIFRHLQSFQVVCRDEPRV